MNDIRGLWQFQVSRHLLELVHRLFVTARQRARSKPGTTGGASFSLDRSRLRGMAAMTSYRITLRDRETQTVVGYYDGSWTTDRCRALALRKCEVAEAHAVRMRERCPRNADLIKVEELEATD